MLEPIREQLKQYSPKTLCKNTMASFDENEQNFCLPSMGTDIFIHYPDFAIKQELDMVPVNGCGKNVWELLKILPDSFDNKKIEKIKQENWMQKLSYRGENRIQEKSETPEKSIYKILFLQE